MDFSKPRELEVVLEDAEKEIFKHWNELANNNIENKEFLDERFIWLKDYSKMVRSRWGIHLGWLEEGKYQSEKEDKYVNFRFNSLINVDSAINELKVLLPNTTAVNKILPVLISGYMVRNSPKPVEENPDARGLYAFLLYEYGGKLPKSKCKTYIKKFHPVIVGYHGLKSQKVDKLLKSQALFRVALYLDIFLNALTQGDKNTYDIHASVYQFEKASSLLKLYFNFDLDELMSLSESELFDKLENALNNMLCNSMNYIKFGMRVLCYLCINETGSPNSLAERYIAESYEQTMWPFSPEEVFLGLSFFPSEDDDDYDDDSEDWDSIDDADDEDGNWSITTVLNSQIAFVNQIIESLNVDKIQHHDPIFISDSKDPQVGTKIQLLIDRLQDLKKLLGADGQMGKSNLKNQESNIPDSIK
jgi:hypothetical protein